MFCRFVMVMFGVKMMAVRDVRMMGGLFVFPGLMMRRGVFVMVSRVFAVLGCVPMMFRCLLVVGHDDCSFRGLLGLRVLAHGQRSPAIAAYIIKA